MRKRTVKCLCDNIFWYLIYLLPLILLFGVTFTSGQFVSLSTAMSSIGLDIFSNNVIYNSLNSVFGSSGFLPFFNNPDLIYYLTYFICTFILHLFVDILLFLPRFAMGFLDNGFGGKHND